MTENTMNEKQRTSIFRKEALQRFERQEHGPMLLARSNHSWLLVSLAFAITFFCTLYLFLGSYRPRATVSGILVPADGAIKVIAPVNGIVSELRIQEGQRVKQGDVLFVMADQRSQTGNQQTTKISDLRLASLAQRQESLKRLRTTTQQLGMTNEAGLRRQHDNINEELQRNQQELDLYARRIQALSKIVANHRELAEKKYISHLELQNKEEQLSSLETQLLGAQRSRSQLTRSSANLLSEIHQAPIKVAGQLAEIDRDLASLELETTEIASRDGFAITAPISGRVTAINANRGQSVSSQALAVIVPENAPLMAHLFAPSKALGFVQSGQSVRLRYEPYPYQTYGMHEGIVLEVSNSPLRPEDFAILSTTIKQEGMYRVTVKIKSQIITKNGKQTTLFPGIALEADIQQDKRRLIDWILAPIRGNANRHL